MDPNRDTEANHPGGYGTEVLCAGWNPHATTLIEPMADACGELVADLANADAETFLNRFYRCQQG
ncbi:MAG: hypothetical protein FJY54_08640 [Betaproteobacteria bacterium]|nr:hypothetical protein [Betaproteobacteria bacterium]